MNTPRLPKYVTALATARERIKQGDKQLSYLGCLDPILHDDMKHHRKCVMHGDRLACLRELRRNDRERQMLQQFLDQDLPEEVVMLVMAELVTSLVPMKFHLKKQEILNSTLRAILGDSQPAQSLYPRLKQALLETVELRLDVAFRHTDGSIHAQLHDELGPNATHIRSFLLVLEVRTDQQYAHALRRATAGMPSLTTQLAGLHTFTLQLELDCDHNEPDLAGTLAKPCYTGYSTRTTYDAIIERLIYAVQMARPGRMQVFGVKYREDRLPQPEPEERFTEVDDRTPTEILEAVVESFDSESSD
ncbi:hypothetical protein LTR36_004883 [Oleoguttula mirabilis]|uniref:Uncharacterized protein n=1 Tax=Oleoguttula mirabilis TaxID=1507867 RepID=A0AAV9JF68_9PEZI|nr:hypothetical protein LTR36_004883 [Oleoguttula mirabilis]